MTTRPPRHLLGGSSRPGTTLHPLPLHDGPSRVFSPLRRPRAPPPPTPIRGDWGPLRRPHGPQSSPPLPRGCHSPSPGGLLFSLRGVFAPYGGSVSPPRWPSQRWLSRRRPRRPLQPPVARAPRFLACPMATLSAGRVPPCTPPNLRPMFCCYSRSPCSIPRCCLPPRLPSPPPSWPCGRSPPSTRPYPRPRTLISP